MYINELSFDDFIEIEILCEDTEKGIKFNTRVDSVNNEILKAAVPENLIRLKDITDVFVYYKTEGKCKKWDCKMLGFERSNLISLIVLSCNLKAENSNSRYAFRIPYDVDMVYDFEDLKIKGRYKDLSATGVAFYSNEKHEIGDKIGFIIEDLGYRLEIEGEIIRKVEQKRNIFKYLYGLKTKEENEKVMSYIFRKQIELIRKKKSRE